MNNKILVLFLACTLFSACSGINFSQLSFRQSADDHISMSGDPLERELEKLESDLDDDAYLQYAIIRSRLKGTSERIYFLKLTSKEKRIYFSYIFQGEAPIVKRSGLLNNAF